MGLIDKEELIADIEMDLNCSVTGKDNAQAVKAMMQRVYDDVRKAPEAAVAVEWRTGIPDTKDEVLVTCQSGSARWVLPGCTYDPKNRAWYHTIVEEHDVEVSPDGDIEHIWNKEERIMVDVIAWAEYPEPYGGEA